MLGGCHIKPEQFFNLIFGYYDRYVERIYEPNAVAGTNTLSGIVVPASEIWVVTNMFGLNFNTNPGVLVHEVYDGTTEYRLRRVVTPGANVSVEWYGHAFLKAGDRLRTIFTSCVLNDDLYAEYVGYKMKVSQ